jgi:hypothetical protein
MSDDLRVDYGKPESLYARLDHLVDTDPIALRDVAWNMAQDVETLNARIAELEAHPAMVVDLGAEARGYDRAIANLRDDEAYLRWCRERNFAPLAAADRAEFADYAEAVKDAAP